MKNYFKFFGIVALVVTIGFLTFSCSSDSNDGGNSKLKGNWVSGNIIVYFSGTNGVFTRITADNTGWAKVKEKGLIVEGKEKFKDIKSSSELVWTGQSLLYDPNNFNLVGFRRCTFTLSEDNKTLKVVVATGLGTDPYVTYTMNGAIAPFFCNKKNAGCLCARLFIFL